MKSYKIKSSQSVTLTLLSGGREMSEPVLSPYGPLEREVEILLRKSCEALDIFLTGSTHLVEPMISKEEITTTK